MKIAFLIMAHGEPGLLARLVRRLRSPLASIHVHIDRSANFGAFRRELAREGIDGVHFAPRVSAPWGTFGSVRASLSLIESALVADPDAGIFVLISGTDYPIRSVAGMHAFFEERPDMSFIECNRLPWAVWNGNGGLDRIRHWHFFFRRSRHLHVEYPSASPPRRLGLRLFYQGCRLFLPRNRPLPPDMTFYGSGTWWNLARGACEWIVERAGRDRDFMRLFRFSYVGDEIFYQTLMMMRDQAAVTHNNLRCVFWDGRRGEYPASVLPEDFEEIRNSGMFFTRKVHPSRSVPLLDRIDAELLGI